MTGKLHFIENDPERRMKFAQKDYWPAREALTGIDCILNNLVASFYSEEEFERAKAAMIAHKIEWEPLFYRVVRTAEEERIFRLISSIEYIERRGKNGN